MERQTVLLRELFVGDRFYWNGHVYSFIYGNTARRHSPDSLKMNGHGYGFKADQLERLDPDTEVIFIPPGS